MQRLNETTHWIGDSFGSFQELNVCRKGKKLDALEESEIYKQAMKENTRHAILNNKVQFKLY